MAKLKDGCPILFIHDWFDLPVSWELQVRHFEPRHLCIAPHLAGHNNVESPPVGQPVSDYNLARFVGTLNEIDEPAAVLAHGRSAILALRIAAMAPERVICLVLVAPEIRPWRIALLSSLAEWWPRAFLPLLLLFSDPLREGLPLFRRWRRRLGALSGRGAAAYLRDARSGLDDALPASVNVPVFLVAGDRDVRSTEDAEELNRRLVLSRLLRYAHLGFNPHRDEPGLVIQAIEDFLAVTGSKRGLIRRLRSWISNLFSP